MNENQLLATSQMMIYRPPEVVFEALVDPVITSDFWFTHGTGRLESGKKVTWRWDQFGVEASIEVEKVTPGQLIRFRWPSDEENTSWRTVEITFSSQADDSTFVEVSEKGFDKSDEHLIQTITGQTEGWALVLSALKAYLEHDIILSVISDHHPHE
ncbi:SRPBCC family protein [Aliifodinibius sp. S!AR15-10]|uniref:SRPBCC family protein n=1 Tax=Aliifodinibius sp. S!AR15-10 TaxID=2950437 RepID=UPI002854EBAB|nr:SRPBCC family protein [Aliifodinibius sp. S!AR15-10]MDR8393898.1 SRPBCC family protein [Aliifodinibius sp. S!AR15-10]